MEDNRKEVIVASDEIMEEESSFDFKTLYTMVLLNWKWFVLSVVVCVCVAALYVKMTDKIYETSAKILVKDDEKKSGAGSANSLLANMQDFGFISGSNGIDNEVEILQSRVLARDAVKNLKLYVEYREHGLLRNTIIYKTQPINVDLDPQSLDKLDRKVAMSERPILPVKLTITNEGGKFTVEGKSVDKEGEETEFSSSFKSLPASAKTPIGTLTFTRNQGVDVLPLEDGEEFYAYIYAPMAMAANYIKNMSVEPTSKTTTIALITLKDKNYMRADDFLRELTECYNNQANADKNEIAVKTEEFINDRLEKINAELGSTESALESFKKRNNLTELTLDATQTLAQSSEYSTKLSEIESQIVLLDYLRKYVEDNKSRYQIIPSNVGLEDKASVELINEYNKNVLDRNRLLRSASEIAPQVLTLTNTLDELETSIRQALLQARHGADIRRQSVQGQYSKYQNKMASAPEQERVLNQIGRQQEVKSGLYLMLLQKREENSISLAATADKGKLIDEPTFEGKTSPKTPILLLVAIVVGLGIPLGILYLLELLKYKIEGHDDVAKLTALPIVVDIPVANESVKSKAGIVVHENTNDSIDEIFRSLRTNIQFMLKENQKVILFTSSTSGEGKTFSIANLSTSFALLGKKVILVGLDIRKPALGKLFGLKDTSRGISQLLSKDKVIKEDVDSKIQNTGVNPNFDVLLAGPIPPNPTELLARQNLADVISILSDEYDYVMLDTAPSGLVTDTLQIAQHADVCCYVCRADYTPKALFTMVNGLVEEQKLKNVCIVVNGIDMSKKKNAVAYGYGHYGHYGHYGNYGHYGHYGHYGNYGHYGQDGEDKSIKR